MCAGGKCLEVCPASKLANFIPPDKPCGKDPSELFSGIFDMVRKNGEFLPQTNRAIAGRIIETT